MRKRLYFLLPDQESARNVVTELLLSRISEQHIHVMAKEGVKLGDLPEASLFQKSDIVHGIESGMIIGGISGLVGSIIAISALQLGSMMGLVVLGCTIFGAGFGIWTASMIGSSTKNSRLREFEQAMNNGKILLMADIPLDKISEITQRIEQHTNTVLSGSEPSIPAFP